MKLSDLIIKAVTENNNLNADEKKFLLEFDIDKINEELDSLKKSLEVTVGERDSALKKLNDYVYFDNVSKIAADKKVRSLASAFAHSGHKGSTIFACIKIGILGYFFEHT